MQTISDMATVARDSVFGQSTKNTRSGAEPPAGGTPGEGTVDSPYDPGNVPEQIPTEPGREPPSGGPPGRGTADAPYDRGNEPEQIQVRGNPASAAADTHPLPSSSIPASKIDNPDPSSSSEMKSALAAHEAENTANKASPNASRKTESESKKANAVNPTSHSALFGLGKKEEGVHPPKDSREVSGTIEEAGQVMGQQAEMERRGASEDDTGGYLGLRKAAMEEEERKRNGGADGRGGATTTTTAAAAEENRDASAFHPPLLSKGCILLTMCLLFFRINGAQEQFGPRDQSRRAAGRHAPTIYRRRDASGASRASFR